VPIKSGFLGDYSQLEEGTGDQPQLFYSNPRTDFHRYDKILLEPIVVYCKPTESWFRQASKEEVQALLDYFDASIRRNLEDELTFVDRPGPGVMRVKVALTEAAAGAVVHDIVSSVVPQPLAISAMKRLILNKATAVGEAAVEMEATDSVTGERLAAGVDKRIGEKFTGKFDKFDQWRATKAAFDYWAIRAKLRVVQAQGRPRPE